MERRRLQLVCYCICLCVLCCFGQRESADYNSDLTSFQLYGGDMLLTPEQWNELKASSHTGSNANRRAVVTTPSARWTGGIVPYELSSRLSNGVRTAVTEAIEEFMRTTCIVFRRRTSSDIHYVKFINGSGCFSRVGRIGGEQTITVGPTCDKRGVVMHEMLHTLGRWHEHNRPDRDTYVTINRNNIKPGKEINFEKRVSSPSLTTQSVPYDYESIMHYSAYAFSRNGFLTIDPHSSIIASKLGQRNGFSRRDIQHISILYCNGEYGSWSDWSAWSTCSASCNGGTQERTRVCEHGIKCPPGTNIESRECNSEPCQEPARWGEWMAWAGCSQSCGGGQRVRVRYCENGNTCSGNRQEFEFDICNTQPCPSEWSSWSSWSACNQSCQGGVQQRNRTCLGRPCEGSSTEEVVCNSDVPCPEANDSAPSVNWTVCTRLCGGGMQFRSLSNGTMEGRACNTQNCHNEHCLTGLVHIGCYIRPESLSPSSLRSFEGSSIDLQDRPEQRLEPVRKCGSSAVSTGQKVFALSSGECLSGSSQVEDYTTAGEALNCTGGKGGQSESGQALVDVYALSNRASFQESAHNCESCGANYCLSDKGEERVTCSNGNAASSLTSLTLLVPFLLLTVQYYV